MRELIAEIDAQLAGGGNDLAMATVLSTWGSAPRKVGAKMVFSPDGEFIAGSVSGGCVEGAVIAAGEEVLATGRPQQLHFGVADETAWGVGLACGGTIEVFVERLDTDIYRIVREWMAANRTGSVVTIVAGSEGLIGQKAAIIEDRVVAGSLSPEPDSDLLNLVAAVSTSSRHALDDATEVFIDVFSPPPKLIIIGGAHIAVVLAQLAKLMGYKVILVDPRRAFGSQTRFPGVDQLIQAWPDKALADIPLNISTALVTLSHDPKIDDPALSSALRSPAFYIGALGSRKTHARRCERLAALGFSKPQLDRIHAPVGLDIGADNPEEIALAIMSQIVAAHRGKLGLADQ